MITWAYQKKERTFKQNDYKKLFIELFEFWWIIMEKNKQNIVKLNLKNK